MSVVIAALSAGTTGTVAADTACTAPEYRQFDFWIGNWTVRWTDDDTKREKTGRNRISRAHDGCVIVERFDGRPGTPLTGSSLSIWVAGEKQWRQTWVDNTGSHLAFTGGWADGRMTLTRAAPEHGPSVMQRMVFRDIRADSLVWDWESSRDGGATWALKWQLRYERVARK